MARQVRVKKNDKRSTNHDTHLASFCNKGGRVKVSSPSVQAVCRTASVQQLRSAKNTNNYRLVRLSPTTTTLAVEATRTTRQTTADVDWDEGACTGRFRTPSTTKKEVS